VLPARQSKHGRPEQIVVGFDEAQRTAGEVRSTRPKTLARRVSRTAAPLASAQLSRFPGVFVSGEVTYGAEADMKKIALHALLAPTLVAPAQAEETPCE
jgi:hypothetical protein